MRAPFVWSYQILHIFFDETGGVSPYWLYINIKSKKSLMKQEGLPILRIKQDIPVGVNDADCTCTA